MKIKILEVLNGVKVFMIENELDSKAVDLQDTKENRYKIIEEICKKCNFQTKFLGLLKV